MTPIEVGIFILVALALAGAGYWVAHNQHTIVSNATNALTRATTIPSGDIAALNAKIDGLGTIAANAANAAQTAATAAIKAVTPTVPPSA